MAAALPTSLFQHKRDMPVTFATQVQRRTLLSVGTGCRLPTTSNSSSARCEYEITTVAAAAAVPRSAADACCSQTVDPHESHQCTVDVSRRSPTKSPVLRHSAETQTQQSLASVGLRSKMVQTDALLSVDSDVFIKAGYRSTSGAPSPRANDKTRVPPSTNRPPHSPTATAAEQALMDTMVSSHQSHRDTILVSDMMEREARLLAVLQRDKLEHEKELAVEREKADAMEASAAKAMELLRAERLSHEVTRNDHRVALEAAKHTYAHATKEVAALQAELARQKRLLEANEEASIKTSSDQSRRIVQAMEKHLVRQHDEAEQRNAARIAEEQRRYKDRREEWMRTVKLQQLHDAPLLAPVGEGIQASQSSATPSSSMRSPSMASIGSLGVDRSPRLSLLRTSDGMYSAGHSTPLHGDDSHQSFNTRGYSPLHVLRSPSRASVSSNDSCLPIALAASASHRSSVSKLATAATAGRRVSQRLTAVAAPSPQPPKRPAAAVSSSQTVRRHSQNQHRSVVHSAPGGVRRNTTALGAAVAAPLVIPSSTVNSQESSMRSEPCVVAEDAQSNVAAVRENTTADRELQSHVAVPDVSAQGNIQSQSTADTASVSLTPHGVVGAERTSPRADGSEETRDLTPTSLSMGGVSGRAFRATCVSFGGGVGDPQHQPAPTPAGQQRGRALSMATGDALAILKRDLAENDGGQQLSASDALTLRRGVALTDLELALEGMEVFVADAKLRMQKAGGDSAGDAALLECSEALKKHYEAQHQVVLEKLKAREREVTELFTSKVAAFERELQSCSDTIRSLHDKTTSLEALNDSLSKRADAAEAAHSSQHATITELHAAMLRLSDSEMCCLCREKILRTEVDRAYAERHGASAPQVGGALRVNPLSLSLRHSGSHPRSGSSAVGSRPITAPLGGRGQRSSLSVVELQPSSGSLVGVTTSAEAHDSLPAADLPPPSSVKEARKEIVKAAITESKHRSSYSPFFYEAVQQEQRSGRRPPSLSLGGAPLA